MKTLKIDSKWSVEYDPSSNCIPINWLRYGEKIRMSPDNIHVAMFFALLEIEERGLVQ